MTTIVVAAAVVERLVIRRAIGATHWDVLIITVGLSLVLRAGAGLTWTHDEFPFPSFFPNRPIALGYVHRDFVEPGTKVTVGDTGGEVARLPFVTGGAV